MKAIVHLGTEKTGTSTIQHFLKKNREALVSQGFYFAKSTGSLDDRKLSIYCLGDDQFDAYHKANFIDTLQKKKQFEEKVFLDLKEEMSHLPSNVHTVIFSSEHLHSLVKQDGQRRKLKAMLGDIFDDIILVSYLRPQIEMAVSHYSTYLKTRGVFDLDDFLKNCDVTSYYYDYWRYLTGWEESFPESDILVRVFDKKQLVSGDVVADFCHAFGIDFYQLGSVVPANESVSPTGQELLKAINRNFPVFIEGVGKNPTRTAFIQMIGKIYAGAGAKPSKDRAIKLQGAFDSINQKVKEKWFPERDDLFDVDYEKLCKQEPVDTSVVSFFENFLGEYKEKNNFQLCGIQPKSVDTIRDAALEVEKYDVNLALDLMQVAYEFRPNGKFIKKKIREYRDYVS